MADLSSKVINLLDEKANELEIDNIVMHSGAVHDSMMLNSITDVGMIFVPSKEGLSHCPEEYTSFESIEKGAELLYHTVLELAKEG